MAANKGFVQFFADVVGAPVLTPATVDATAYGTALLALLGAGRPAEFEAGAGTTTAPREERREGSALARRKFAHAVKLSQEWGATAAGLGDDHGDDGAPAQCRPNSCVVTP
jgi:sugar (pentulose or hexulose) kinase